MEETVTPKPAEAADDASDSSVDVYEVEKIVGKKIIDGQILYKVRWVGYGPAWDTFEPPDNLGTCDDLIETYQKQEEEKKQKRSKKAQRWTYISSDDENEASGAKSLLKDRFWDDLEHGKVNVMQGDLYTKIKSGRAAKPKSLRERPAYRTPPRGNATTASDSGETPSLPPRRKRSAGPRRRRSPRKKPVSKSAADASDTSCDDVRASGAGTARAESISKTLKPADVAERRAAQDSGENASMVTMGTKDGEWLRESNESFSIDTDTLVECSVDMDAWIPPEDMIMDIPLDTSAEMKTNDADVSMVTDTTIVRRDAEKSAESSRIRDQLGDSVAATDSPVPVAMVTKEPVAKETSVRSAWDLLVNPSTLPTPSDESQTLSLTSAAPLPKVDFSPSKIRKISKFAFKITTKKKEIDRTKRLLSPAKMVEMTECSARTALTAMKVVGKVLTAEAVSEPVGASSPRDVTSDVSMSMTSSSDVEGAARSRPLTVAGAESPFRPLRLQAEEVINRTGIKSEPDTGTTETPESNVDVLETKETPESNVDVVETTGTPESNADVVETTETPESNFDVVETTETPESNVHVVETTETPESNVDVVETTETPELKREITDTNETVVDDITKQEITESTRKDPTKKCENVEKMDSNDSTEMKVGGKKKNSNSKMGPRSKINSSKLKRSPSSESLKSTVSFNSNVSFNSSVSSTLSGSLGKPSSVTSAQSTSAPKTKLLSKMKEQLRADKLNKKKRLLSRRRIHKKVRRFKLPPGLKISGKIDLKKTAVVLIERMNAGKYPALARLKAKAISRSLSTESTKSESTSISSKSSSDTIIVGGSESDHNSAKRAVDKLSATSVEGSKGSDHFPKKRSKKKTPSSKSDSDDRKSDDRKSHPNKSEPGQKSEKKSDQQTEEQPPEKSEKVKELTEAIAKLEQDGKAIEKELEKHSSMKTVGERHVKVFERGKKLKEAKRSDSRHNKHRKEDKGKERDRERSKSREKKGGRHSHDEKRDRARSQEKGKDEGKGKAVPKDETKSGSNQCVAEVTTMEKTDEEAGDVTKVCERLESTNKSEGMIYGEDVRDNSSRTGEKAPVLEGQSQPSISRDRSGESNMKRMREPPRPSRVIQIEMNYPKFQKQLGTTTTNASSGDVSRSSVSDEAITVAPETVANAETVATSVATVRSESTEHVDMEICNEMEVKDVADLSDEDFFALMDREVEHLSEEDLERMDRELEEAKTTVLTPVEMKTAVKAGDLAKLKLVLTNAEPGVYNLEICDHTGMTLLMLAAFSGHTEVCDLLIRHGANVNAAQKNGATALIHAAERGHAPVVTKLLQLGAHVNAQNSIGESALIRAVRKGQKSVVEALLKYGPNTAQTNNADMSAIRLSQLIKNLEIRELFDDFNASLRAVFVEEIAACTGDAVLLREPIFPIQCYSLCEGRQFTLTFPHEIRPCKDGFGTMLCLAHALVTEEEGVRCRLFGACAVRQVMLNNVAQVPLTQGGMFVMTFNPLHNGKNELDIRTDNAPKSRAKLVVGAYRVELF